MFTQFSLRVWVSEYTCRPMIANLLYWESLHFNVHAANIVFMISSLPLYDAETR